VVSVSASAEHRFSKQPRDSVLLVEGLGVEGDSHAGTTVQHRSRVARSPEEPNLRQVHLLHTELFAELAATGHVVEPGDLGENITTTGVDLLGLPTDTLLRIGPEAEVRLTGLRNPCRQIDRFQPGLLARVLVRGESGEVVRRAGVMGVVSTSGRVHPGDPLHVVLPPGPHRPLTRV